jgi:hypothetical protein
VHDRARVGFRHRSNREPGGLSGGTPGGDRHSKPAVARRRGCDRAGGRLRQRSGGMALGVRLCRRRQRRRVRTAASSADAACDQRPRRGISSVQGSLPRCDEAIQHAQREAVCPQLMRDRRDQGVRIPWTTAQIRFRTAAP